MNISLLFGGKSGEHEVSLLSASYVAREIDSKKFKVIPIGISKKGVWFLQSDEELHRVRSDEKNSFNIIEDEKNLVSVIPGHGKNSFSVERKSLEIDVVFPCLHGTNCEDGILQGLLESAGVPYVGCSVAASA
ncbi:D-alanine--D-alanine ligase A, partial [Parabacteroides distasonis]